MKRITDQDRIDEICARVTLLELQGISERVKVWLKARLPLPAAPPKRKYTRKQSETLNPLDVAALRSQKP